MLDKTTPSWAIECTDGCGLSRTGYYACAFGSFVAAALLLTLGTTAVIALLGVPETTASFAVVFGFFALWAGAWLTTAAIWHRWIARATA